GPSCDQCSAQASGSPLVTTTSKVDGTFTLTNMPVGANIPLVIQLGRWRRQITISNVASCTSTMLSGDQTRLPANQSEADIPHIAVATGLVDALECVIRRIGVDDSEFTNSSGTGRIHLYTDNGASPPAGSGTALTAASLYGSLQQMEQYDAVLFD